MTGDLQGYQYVVLRCVPRADREEFLNVGVVLYSQAHDFLGCAGHVDEDRLRALASDLDVDSVRSALEAVHRVCEGEGPRMLGATGRDSLSVRFGFLSAPRSTVVRPGPVHGGATADPAAELARLCDALVR